MAYYVIISMYLVLQLLLTTFRPQRIFELLGKPAKLATHEPCPCPSHYAQRVVLFCT